MGMASELSRRLSDDAEAVCRAYLPNGRRSGRYWIVGNVAGERGRSLFVKLWGDRRRALDGRRNGAIWRSARPHPAQQRLAAIAAKPLTKRASFCTSPGASAPPPRARPLPIRDTRSAAARLYAISRPVPGTLAETYLRNRGITASLDWSSLRFHPACYYRPDESMPLERWPALLGAVTDLNGKLTGLQRTWLARDGGGKAPIDDPRRAMGHLLGHAVRFGEPSGVMAAGEGIETVLSLLSLFPALPMAAGLSAAHLAAFLFPAALRRLYLLRDNDAAGAFAEERLWARCRAAAIELRVLRPAAKDLNADLRGGPPDAVRDRMLRADAGRRPCSLRRKLTFALAAGSSGVRGPPRCYPAPPRNRPPSRLSCGEEARAGCGGQRLRSVYFPPRPEEGRFASRNKINVPRRPPLRSGRGPLCVPRGAAPASGSGKSLAIKAARGGRSHKEDTP